MRRFFAQATVAFHCRAKASTGFFQNGLVGVCWNSFTGETVVGCEVGDVDFYGAFFEAGLSAGNFMTPGIIVIKLVARAGDDDELDRRSGLADPVRIVLSRGDRRIVIVVAVNPKHRRLGKDTGIGDQPKLADAAARIHWHMRREA